MLFFLIQLSNSQHDTVHGYIVQNKPFPFLFPFLPSSVLDSSQVIFYFCSSSSSGNNSSATLSYAFFAVHCFHCLVLSDFPSRSTCLVLRDFVIFFAISRSTAFLTFSQSTKEKSRQDLNRGPPAQQLAP